MNPSLTRTALCILGAARRSPLAVLDVSVIPMRVWPGDLDFNLHMNNGRYLTLMDLGRLDFMIRSGLGSVVLRRRWRPVVGSAGFRYRRPLEPFARFELHTRLSCWDSKWFYMEQSFQRAGAVYGAGVVKALFKSGRRKVMPSEVLEAMGVRIDSPPIPAGLIEWQLADSKLAARDRQRPRAAG